KLIAPHLFNAISTRIARRRTVADAMVDRRWIRDIHGGLSILALSMGLCPSLAHPGSCEPDGSNGPFHLEMDNHRRIHCRLGLQDHARRPHSHPWRSSGLEIMGTPAGEVFHLACS